MPRTTGQFGYLRDYLWSGSLVGDKEGSAMGREKLQHLAKKGGRAKRTNPQCLRHSSSKEQQQWPAASRTPSRDHEAPHPCPAWAGAQETPCGSLGEFLRELPEIPELKSVFYKGPRTGTKRLWQESISPFQIPAQCSPYSKKGKRKHTSKYHSSTPSQYSRF